MGRPTEAYDFDQERDDVFKDTQSSPEIPQYPIVPQPDAGSSPQSSEFTSDKTQIYTDDSTLAKPREEVFAWLIAVKGDMKGQIIRIAAGQNLIGRHDKSEICIKDNFVSELHATVTYREGAFYAWDLGSTNGSKLNGEPLLSAVRLNDGDILQFGKQVLIFKWIDPAIIESLKD